MSATHTYDAIVIGAGANGLVAAAVLAKSGRRVLVLESTSDIGGQARSVEFGSGFRSSPLGLDAGWLPPAVARAIGLPNLPMVAPEYSVTVAEGDGKFLGVHADPVRAAETIRRRSTRDADRWNPFVTMMRKLSGFLEALYQLPPPDIDTSAIAELPILLGLGRKFRALGRADMTELLRVMPMPVQDLFDDRFELEPLKAALAAGGVRDIRQGPRSGGTTFVLMHYLVGGGAGSMRARPWFRDGPDAFIQAVSGIVRQNGGTIRTGADIARIVVQDDAVSGIAFVDGTEFSAPVVLSTADPVRTLLGMVDPVWLDPEFLHAVKNIKLRGCTAVVQYALDALPELPGIADAEKALAGIVSLTPTLDGLERAADAAKYGTVSPQPHVEITVPTLRWPALAPAASWKHVLVARAQYAPYHLRGGEPWDSTKRFALADSITAAIERSIPRFGSTVKHRAALMPLDIEQQFGLTQGALTHGELTLDQILFMRPVPGWGRHAMPIVGLYLGGAGAHPGPGVLGGAGWLAARRVLRDQKTAKGEGKR
jgi:phytoene dehydrogenase-like protein